MVTNELGQEMDVTAGTVPSRPILVIEYPVGTTILNDREVPSSQIAVEILRCVNNATSRSGLCLPIDFDFDGKRVPLWSILKSPGWRVYELQPPDASQTKEEGIT